MISPPKKILIFLFLWIVTCMVGCDEEIDCPPAALLNVIVDASYDTMEDDHWIILHDQAGDILAFKSFESNEAFALNSEAPVRETKIGVTIVRRHPVNGSSVFSINSYLNIEKGRTLEIRTHEYTPMDFSNAGSFYVEVEGALNSDQATISDNLGAYSTGYNNPNLIFQGDYFGRSKKIVQLTDPFGNLKYKVLENTQANDSYLLNVADFSSVEQIVNFTFPESNKVYLTIIGREFDQTWNDRGFVINNHYKWDTHATIKGGYYSWMDRYETNLTVQYADHSLTYTNVGAIPYPAIAWPHKSDFSISNSSISNFSTSADVPYVFQHSIWQYVSQSGDVILWNISNPESAHVFKALPDELVTPYPVLSFENMTLISTAFYTESESYDSYVEKNISGAKEPTAPSVGIVINN